MGRVRIRLWMGVCAAATLLPAAVRGQSCPDPARVVGSERGVLAHVRYLADDGLEGRGVASAGERCAAAYIADIFDEVGLTPRGDGGSFFQSFDVRTGSEIVGPGSLTISPLEGEGGNPWDVPARDWRPYGFSGSGQVEGVLTYAAEGVSRAGRGAEALPSMEGRIAVVEATTAGSPAGDLYADPHFKATVAQGRGAVALLILHDDGPLPDPVREDRPFLRIPVLAVGGDAADELRRAARAGGEARLSAETRPAMSQARNVVALLPGSEPKLAREFVIVGA
ncbi:MAG: hypothetical protein P8188_08515, partial [Gemmatimonadota bacterium]